MQLPKLKYLSEIKTEELRNEIADNLDRYTQGDFNDLAQHNGWEIELGAVTVDHNLLTQMDGSKLIAELEQSNSMLVFQALKGMDASPRERRKNLGPFVSCGMPRVLSSALAPNQEYGTSQVSYQ